MLRVAVLELPAQWGKPQAALQRADAMLARTPADLVLLPEASLTGYVSPDGDFDLTRFAEPMGGPTARACAELAKKHRTHLVAPLILREGDALYNALTCFSPEGSPLFTYRKRHPWMPETWATPGPDPLPLVEIGGKTVTAAICFDVHFLEEESAEQLEQADLLLFASAWVDDGPEPARPPLLKHLAQRFHLHVANANWGVGIPRIPGQGSSIIYAPDGRALGATAEL